jgi:hypothetical protein
MARVLSSSHFKDVTAVGLVATESYGEHAILPSSSSDRLSNCTCPAAPATASKEENTEEEHCFSSTLTYILFTHEAHQVDRAHSCSRSIATKPLEEAIDQALSCPSISPTRP